jgi:hypothetical protein
LCRPVERRRPWKLCWRRLAGFGGFSRDSGDVPVIDFGPRESTWRRLAGFGGFSRDVSGEISPGCPSVNEPPTTFTPIIQDPSDRRQSILAGHATDCKFRMFESMVVNPRSRNSPSRRCRTSAACAEVHHRRGIAVARSAHAIGNVTRKSIGRLDSKINLFKIAKIVRALVPKPSNAGHLE